MPSQSPNQCKEFPMIELPRREFMLQGSAAIAALTAFQASRLAQAFPGSPGDKVIPWLDQPPENPVPQVVANQLKWEDVDSWITPNDKFFSVAHYDRPVIDEKNWKLEIGGLVEAAADLHAGRTHGAAAAGGRLHARMLRQPRLSLVSRRHRHRPLGGHAAGGGPRGGGRAGRRHRGGVLRQRCGRGNRARYQDAAAVSPAACRWPMR